MTELLIVDDDMDLLEMMDMACAALGYPAATASDSASAMRQLAELSDLRLALIDIRLGRENGFDLARRMMALRPGLAVLFLSGAGDKSNRPADFAQATLLAKPLPLAGLQAALESALNTAHRG